MIQGKIAGITLGGIAGYLLISKAIHAAENMVANVCSALEWRSYYKYDGGQGVTVPPGYAMQTRKIDPEHEVVVESPEGRKEREKAENGEEQERRRNAGEVIADAITSVAKEAIDKLAKKKDNMEGDMDGDEDPFDVPPDESTPLYADSLENGVVEVTEENENESLD